MLAEAFSKAGVLMGIFPKHDHQQKDLLLAQSSAFLVLRVLGI